MSSDSTIENRVYLFKDLAAAWLSANPGALQKERDSALSALADIAYVCCVFADEEELDAKDVAAKIRQGNNGA